MSTTLFSQFLLGAPLINAVRWKLLVSNVYSLSNLRCYSSRCRLTLKLILHVLLSVSFYTLKLGRPTEMLLLLYLGITLFPFLILYSRIRKKGVGYIGDFVLNTLAFCGAFIYPTIAGRTLNISGNILYVYLVSIVPVAQTLHIFDIAICGIVIMMNIGVSCAVKDEESVLNQIWSYPSLYQGPSAPLQGDNIAAASALTRALEPDYVYYVTAEKLATFAGVRAWYSITTVGLIMCALIVLYLNYVVITMYFVSNTFSRNGLIKFQRLVELENKAIGNFANGLKRSERGVRQYTGNSEMLYENIHNCTPADARTHLRKSIEQSYWKVRRRLICERGITPDMSGESSNLYHFDYLQTDPTRNSTLASSHISLSDLAVGTRRFIINVALNFMPDCYVHRMQDQKPAGSYNLPFITSGRGYRVGFRQLYLQMNKFWSTIHVVIQGLEIISLTSETLNLPIAHEPWTNKFSNSEVEKNYLEWRAIASRALPVSGLLVCAWICYVINTGLNLWVIATRAGDLYLLLNSGFRFNQEGVKETLEKGVPWVVVLGRSNLKMIAWLISSGVVLYLIVRVGVLLHLFWLHWKQSKASSSTRVSEFNETPLLILALIILAMDGVLDYITTWQYAPTVFSKIVLRSYVPLLVVPVIGFRIPAATLVKCMLLWGGTIGVGLIAISPTQLIPLGVLQFLFYIVFTSWYAFRIDRLMRGVFSTTAYPYITLLKHIS